MNHVLEKFPPTYRARILQKMAVATNAELVRYAARYGLIG